MKGAAERVGESWPRLRDPGLSRVFRRRAAVFVVTLYAPLPSFLPSFLPSPPMGTRRPFGVSVSHLYRHLVRSVRLPTHSFQPTVFRGPVCAE